MAGVAAIAMGIGYAAFLLVGIEVIMLSVAVAVLSLYLVARRWIKIRERGIDHLICRLDQSLQSKGQIHSARTILT